MTQRSSKAAGMIFPRSPSGSTAPEVRRRLTDAHRACDQRMQDGPIFQILSGTRGAPRRAAILLASSPKWVDLKRSSVNASLSTPRLSHCGMRFQQARVVLKQDRVAPADYGQDGLAEITLLGHPSPSSHVYEQPQVPDLTLQPCTLRRLPHPSHCRNERWGRCLRLL